MAPSPPPCIYSGWVTSPHFSFLEHFSRAALVCPNRCCFQEESQVHTPQSGMDVTTTAVNIYIHNI